MEPAPYTTAVLFFRISSIAIIPFAIVGRRPNLRLSSRTRLADLYPSCQKQYTIGVNHFIPWTFRRCIFFWHSLIAFFPGSGTLLVMDELVVGGSIKD